MIARRRCRVTLIGRLAVWTINRINLANHSLYSVLLLAFIFFDLRLHRPRSSGNGYLAVYLAGLVVGNYKLAQKRSLNGLLRRFHVAHADR